MLRITAARDACRYEVGRRVGGIRHHNICGECTERCSEKMLRCQMHTNGYEAASVDPGGRRMGRPNNMPRMICLLVAVPDGRIQECIDQDCQILQAKQTGV